MASPLGQSSDEESFHSLTGRDDEPSSPQAKSRAIAPAAIAQNVSSASQHQQIHDGTIAVKHTGPANENAVNATIDEDGEQEDDLVPPEHPLKSMQGPFEESILESSLEQQRPKSRANAEARRQQLLDAQRFDESWTTRWRQRPEAQYHPLLKLMSQITFGMHLLQQNQAKSNQEVVKILQGHVDEVDNWLEQTAEDIDLAIRDIEERIRFLQLPMQHMKVFDIMLEDNQFRTQLSDGNDKIERIIDRTARAMNASLSDVQKGRQATRELSKYLNSVQSSWPFDNVELEAIFNAMRGNEEGWKKCYKTLQTKGNHLGNKLIELGTIIGEMSRMAAAASRRTSSPSPPKQNRSSVTSSTVLRSRFSVDAAVPSGAVPAKDKPLPRSPAMSSSKNRPVSYHHRFERPREPVPTPLKPVIENERPRTSTGETPTARANAFRNAGPLSSHPPATQRPSSAGNDRSNGSLSTKMGLSRPRTQDERTLKAPVSESADSSSRNRDSILFPRKDSMNGTSFMRRWSIKKKQPSIVSTEQPTTASAQDDRKTSAIRSKSAPPRKDTRRLDSVTEQPEPAPQLTEERLIEAQEAIKKAGPPPPEPEDLKFLAHEPKTLRGSFRLGRSNARQSVISDAGTESTRARSEAPSIASSIRRRSVGIKNFFQRKP